MLGAGLAVPPAQGSVIAEHNWDDGPEPWHSTYGDVNLTNPQDPGGNPDGWLQVEFPATAQPELNEEGWVDIVYVDAGNFFAGNWVEPGHTVQFDFYAANNLPQDVQLQFGSTNGNVWGYNVTDQITQTQTWTTVEVGLGYSSAWGPLPGFDDTEDQFLADLSAIDWIGIYIWREDAGVEIYGLDNFRLLVPEPTEWALMAAVLVGAGWSRTRRRPVAAKVPVGRSG
jgi:hypothetical protein